MRKPGKIRMLTIASLSAVALAAPIALAQTTSTNQEAQRVTRGEGHGRGHGKGQGKGWGERGERGDRAGRMQSGMFRGITLTDDQKAKMKQVSQSFRERNQSLRQEHRAKRQELRQATEGGSFNEALVTQKLQESASLQAKLMGEQFKMRQEMQSVLTSEQKAQIEQKRAESKAKWGERGGRKVQ